MGAGTGPDTQGEPVGMDTAPQVVILTVAWCSSMQVQVVAPRTITKKKHLKAKK